MAGNRRREGAPWGGMNRNNNGQRAFHRTEASRPEGRENGQRGGKPRDWEQNRAAGQADREDSFRRGARPNNRRGAERPAGNPPRTGSFHPVPRAVFDGEGGGNRGGAPRATERRPAPEAALDGRMNPPRGDRRPNPPHVAPKAVFDGEPPKDPVLRNAAQRANRPPMPPVPEEIPENLLVGRNPIREAIKNGHAIEKLLVAKGDLSGAARDIVRMALEKGVVVQEVERVRLDQIYRNHQGMLAYVSAGEYATVEDMFRKAEAQGEEPFFIILDGITDPHNLGAIIRSAECTGAHGVIIPERRSVGLTPACVKAAAGATEYMPVAKVTNLNREIEALQKRGVWVMAAAMDGESIYGVDLTGPVALVIGSEGDGVSQLTLKKCDRVVSLPMRGHIDSLNASVAAGAMMYAVLQARS